MASLARNIAKIVTTVVGSAYASQTRVKIVTENICIENDGLGEENIGKVLDTGVKIASTSMISDMLIGDNPPADGK